MFGDFLTDVDSARRANHMCDLEAAAVQSCQINAPPILTFTGLLFEASNSFRVLKVKSILTELSLKSLCAELLSAAGFHPGDLRSDGIDVCLSRFYKQMFKGWHVILERRAWKPWLGLLPTLSFGQMGGCQIIVWSDVLSNSRLHLHAFHVSCAARVKKPRVGCLHVTLMRV